MTSSHSQRRRAKAAASSRTMLYCGPDRPTFERLIDDMGRVRELGVLPAPGDGKQVQHPKAALTWLPAHTMEQAQHRLATTFLNMVVIDLRWITDEIEHEERINKARALLKILDDVQDIEARYGFHRIMVLVSGPHGQRIDDLLVELGGLGIRHVLKERRFRGGETDEFFAGRVLDEAVELLFKPRALRSALCAAGGGITAIFFELGALKCLDDCLVGGSVNDFDLYFGISAGAVVTSMVANGYSPDEIMASISGFEGGRIPPLDLSIARLGHLNGPDLRWRMGEAAKAGGRALWRMARGGEAPTLDDLFLGTTALVGAPFRSDRYEELLRRVLTAPGATNDFRRLRRPLFVGATNQDTRRHVLFGDEAHDAVPISKAVQGSLSINPAFSAVKIDGAWFEDGAVTRTSNFDEAIHRGADLLFILDPFVPYHSKVPGFSHSRGLLYNIDQDVRSLSFTRFETAQSQSLRRHPEVRSYTLLPNNRLRRLLSLNPMDHRVHLEVFRGSYLATLRRIQSVRHRLEGDLSIRGLSLDTGPSEQIALRLEAALARPVFADFFLNGRVELRRPRLSLDPRRAASTES